MVQDLTIFTRELIEFIVVKGRGATKYGALCDCRVGKKGRNFGKKGKNDYLKRDESYSGLI